MEKMQFSKFSIENSATIMIIGSTGSGKTYFVSRLIRERAKLFKQPIKRVVYCYEVYQKIFEPLENQVNFVKGLISERVINSWNREHTLLIIDDLMFGSFSKSDEELLVKLYGVLSHHLNVTVIFITQNAFNKSKYMRTISLNTHYIVLFANRRDGQQVRTLGRQLFSRDTNAFIDIYEETMRSEPSRSSMRDRAVYARGVRARG